MFTLRTTLIAAALAGAAVVPAAIAQGTATTLSTEQAPTRVAAWEATVMWSQLDQETGDYELVQSVDGGAPAAVGVAQRSGGPFDIDLGTDELGEPAAVYTRDGDIYQLDVATGDEAMLEHLSSPTRVERDPTIQDGRIAFIRRDRGSDHLRIGIATDIPLGSILMVRRPSIISAELGERHVAYVDSTRSERRVHVRNIRTGAERRVYRARSGGANFANVTRPAYVAAPEGFMWARTNLGSGAGNRLVRYTLRGSRLDYARGSRFLNSTAWAGGALGAATASSLDGSETAGACTDNERDYCFVQLSGPVSFTDH